MVGWKIKGFERGWVMGVIKVIIRCNLGGSARESD